MKVYNILLMIVSLIGFIIITLNSQWLLLMLPLTYLFCVMLLSKFHNTNLYIIKISFLVMGLIRLLIIPILISISRDYRVDNLPLGYAYITQSIYFIAIEYIIGTVFLIGMISIFKNSVNQQSSFKLLGSSIAYAIVILLALTLFIVFPQARDSISFMAIKANTNGRTNEDINSYFTLIQFLMQFSLALLFIVSSYLSYRKYIYNPNWKLLILPLIFAALNVSFIIGERRSYQVYTLIAIVSIITLLFKYHSKKINLVVLGLGLFVFIGVTLYKELYIFAYSSYSQALKFDNLKALNIADTFQSYFYGPHNIAGFIEFNEIYRLSIKQFFYDIGRSIFGISSLISDESMITSQYYNAYIYDNRQLTGHLISSISYGYAYFGFFFPLVICFNLLLGGIIEYLNKNTNYLELKYISMYILMRVVFNLFSNPPQLISHITLIVAMDLSIVLGSLMLKHIIPKKKKFIL